MYYGNAAATVEPAASSTYGSQNVWDSGYKGVWHLSQTGTNPQVLDSTSNGNSSTTQTWTPTTSGEIDGAGSFSTSSINLGSGSSLQITGSTVTVSAWIKSSATQGDIFFRNLSSTPWEGYAMAIGGNLTNGKLGFWYGNSTNWDFSNSTVNDNNWHQVTVAFDSANSYFYIDGQLNATVPKAGTVRLSSSAVAAIGYDAGSSARYLSGSIDEVSVSSVARSSQWISAEYANQNSPSTFATSGSQANNAVTSAGTLKQSGAGTLNANGAAVTATGLATVSNGTYQASTGTQTFNGGLTVSGGTFTSGASGAVDVNGAFNLSSGTFTQATSTLNVSGNFTGDI